MKIFTARVLGCCLLFLGTMPQVLSAFDQNDLDTLLKTKRCIECDLTRVNLANADLSRATLTGSNLENADLSNAVLNLADLARTNLQRANLANAQLSGADLFKADLREAVLTDARIDGAYLVGTILEAEQPPSTEKELTEFVSRYRNLPDTPEAAERALDPRWTSAMLWTPGQFNSSPVISTVPASQPAENQALPVETPVISLEENRRSPMVEEKLEEEKSVAAADLEKSGTSQPSASEAADSRPGTLTAATTLQPPAVEPSSRESAAGGDPAAELPPPEPALSDLEKLLKTNRCVGCNLAGLDLSGRKLKKAYLERADLSGANLSDANLQEANFKGANLTGANLEKADLENADFYKADLTGANFRKADLENAALEGALLKDTIFEGADMDGVTR